ncbi:hypothetical protein [Agitococcus lubricus]|uniref:Uncharacterized protein n=1 Tax=Agitococcus lubricus TaxID=1077255 RepID=A0A2T5J254_9GAMM|nr:hypothetical protein [Agitococcus lubricus]PTQ90606.1 hypothetical protein C8N29_1024 [Agitococcus lubricus]
MSNIAVEGRRQAYLAALGLPLWTVRPESLLSHRSQTQDFVAYESELTSTEPASDTAPVSQAFAPVDVSTPVVDKPKAVVVMPPHADFEPPLEAYVDDPEYQQAQLVDSFLKAAVPEPNKPPVTPNNPVLATAVEQPIHFRFGVYPCGVWQLIVPRPQLLSPSEMQLLANIQLVMQTESASPLLFTWPMVNNYALPRHKQAAIEALTAFFKNQAISDKGYIVLADHEQQLLEVLRASTPKSILMHASLSALLQQPLDKKALWLSLIS